MSDTPKTDKLAGEWIACETVPASHARELERENAMLREALGEADDMLARIESEDHGHRADEITVLRGRIISFANASDDRQLPGSSTPESTKDRNG